MTLPEKLQRLADEFAEVPDPQERLALVVERARRAPVLPAAGRTDEFRVPGCLSLVWLLPEMRDGTCHFRGDAQGPVVRGLVIFLCAFYDGAAPGEILRVEADPLATIEIIDQLSPTRRHGIAAVREAIRSFARGHLDGGATQD